MRGDRERGKSFALIGVAGFVARRHLTAIRDCGGTLEAAYDVSDSVGQIDALFPSARFFTDFERFSDHVERLGMAGTPVDYVVVCSPNYLHRSHSSFAMRAGSDVICEKPVVLDPADIDVLAEIERDSGRMVNTILQLRLHPSIVEMRRRIADDRTGRVFDAELTYVTARGQWYYESWKSKSEKSGGIATNIGVHFFDMLCFAFGRPVKNIIHHRALDCASGYLEYDRARVRWFLSINGRDKSSSEGFAQRSLTIDGVGLYDFSKGFEDLHTASYREIIAGRGFPLAAARPSIETVAHIRNAAVEPGKGQPHPLLEDVLSDAKRYRDGYPI